MLYKKNKNRTCRLCFSSATLSLLLILRLTNEAVSSPLYLQSDNYKVQEPNQLLAINGVNSNQDSVASTSAISGYGEIQNLLLYEQSSLIITNDEREFVPEFNDIAAIGTGNLLATLGSSLAINPILQKYEIFYDTLLEKNSVVIDSSSGLGNKLLAIKKILTYTDGGNIPVSKSNEILSKSESLLKQEHLSVESHEDEILSQVKHLSKYAQDTEAANGLIEHQELPIKDLKTEIPKTNDDSLSEDSSVPKQSETLAQTAPEIPVSPSSSPVSPELQQLRQGFLIEEPKVALTQSTNYVVAPSASISTPIGFGASFGQLFGGVGFQSRTRFRDSADGGLAIGAGLGDPQKILGLDTTVSIWDLFGKDSFGRGGISFKIHRLLPESFSIAVGFENAATWGYSDAGSSIYGVISKFFLLKDTTEEPFSQLTVSLGLGGGRFRSENDIINGVDSVGVFGSVGVRVIEPLSVVAEWSGQDLNAGISLIPIQNIPLTVNLAGADLTGNAGDGARFVMSIGYNYFFPR